MGLILVTLLVTVPLLRPSGHCNCGGFEPRHSRHFPLCDNPGLAGTNCDKLADYQQLPSSEPRYLSGTIWDYQGLSGNISCEPYCEPCVYLEPKPGSDWMAAGEMGLT